MPEKKDPELDAVKRPYLSKLESLKAQKESLLPTPPIGTPVQWFARGDMTGTQPIAGVVTKHVRPGVLGLVTFPFRSQPVHCDNVLWCKHPQGQRKHDKNVQRNGTWDYVSKNPPAKSHYSLHEQQIEDQIKQLESQMKSAIDQYLDRQRMKEELEQQASA